MKSIIITLAFVTIAYGAISTTNASCKEYCGGFCLDTCQSTLATPICLGEKCQCLCPTRQANCNATFCNSYCQEKAQTRKFEAHCEQDNQVCKCQFEQSKFVPTKMLSKLQPVNITYVADKTLLDAEFKCTEEFCSNYCKKRGEGRKFKNYCDDKQSCHCEYEQKPLPSLASLVGNMKTTQGKCEQKWCSDFCGSKSDGRKFTALCDENQTCKCDYPRQTFIKASGGPDNRHTRENSSTVTSDKKFHCTKSWCDEYCESKGSGRKFTSSCENERCKCEYAWQPTGKRVFSTGSTSN